MRPIILVASLGLLSAGVHAKVTIDGRADEAAWANARRFGDFVQSKAFPSEVPNRWLRLLRLRRRFYRFRAWPERRALLYTKPEVVSWIRRCSSRCLARTRSSVIRVWRA